MPGGVAVTLASIRVSAVPPGTIEGYVPSEAACRALIETVTPGEGGAPLEVSYSDGATSRCRARFVVTTRAHEEHVIIMVSAPAHAALVDCYHDDRDPAAVPACDAVASSLRFE